MKELLNEYDKWSVRKESLPIKPFSSLEKVWLLLNDDDFRLKIRVEKKFFLFVRKKLFWILDENHHDSYLLLRGVELGEDNELVVSIVHQILLTYFSDDLKYLDLIRISLANDEYNSITAYLLQSKRGTDRKKNLN